MRTWMIAVMLVAMPAMAAAQAPHWEITPSVRFDGSDFSNLAGAWCSAGVRTPDSA